jgi:inosine-uridine nucleoside N-ribohydrolase
MEKRKIILDCDPGHDDAIAIMMAAKHPAIDLLGITIVAGNQTLDKTLINGLNVCQRGIGETKPAANSADNAVDQRNNCDKRHYHRRHTSGDF